MKNYDKIKNLSIEEMAISITCPAEMGYLDDYRCDKETPKTHGECQKCCLEWLNEEV